MAILLDTNFLLAVMLSTDQNHTRAIHAMRTIMGDRVVSVAVLPELFYMVTIRANYRAAVRSHNALLTEDFKIEPLFTEDRQRMSQIMQKYADAKFDFVDCAIMALSERLNITRVATFDLRDFSIFRRSDGTFLELVPSSK